MRRTTLNKWPVAGIVGRRASRRRSSRSGFTLIELVVVIGIMLLLLGLTLSVGVAVRTRSETRETENTLRLLDAATQEWERSSDRQLSWGEDDTPGGSVYDVQGRRIGALLTPEILVITEVLQTVTRPRHVKEIIAQVDADFIYTYRSGEFPSWIQPGEEQDVIDRFIGGIAVLDAWGHPIYATHPGRVSDPGVFTEDGNPIYGVPDADGTIRTYNEGFYGVAKNRQVCFISAGPDGEFGMLDASEGSTDFEQTKDNLYSYPVTPP
ncbi:MAG: prepilin-type N-terminal cleavage/methylation domain-containing protein [Phycisphaerales bacterium]